MSGPGPGFPRRQEPSTGRPPHQGTSDSSPPEGATQTAPEMLPWARPGFHPPQPLSPHPPGHPSSVSPQRFGHSPNLPPYMGDFAALHEPPSSFRYPDSYQPPMYRDASRFGLPTFPSAQNDGPRDVSHTPYVPHYAPLPYHYHGYDDQFNAPSFAPPARDHGDSFRLPRDYALPRAPLPEDYVPMRAMPSMSTAYGATESTGRNTDPSPSIAHGNPRERPRFSGPRPARHSTDISDDTFSRLLDDNATGAAAQASHRARARAFARPFSESPDVALWTPGEEARSRPDGTGYPTREQYREQYRERVMQRSRELARLRHSSGELSPQSDGSDNDGARARRLAIQTRGLATSRHYEPPSLSEAQIVKFKAGLKKMALGELPEGASTTCDICDKDYSKAVVTPCEEAEVAVELPCKHLFGEDCLNTWFNTCKNQKHKVTCPMCRKVLIEPPTRRNRSLQWLQMRYNPHAERDPGSGIPHEASNLMHHLDEGLRDILPAPAFEHFRALLAARGTSAVLAGDLGAMIRESLQHDEGSGTQVPRGPA